MYFALGAEIKGLLSVLERVSIIAVIFKEDM